MSLLIKIWLLFVLSKTDFQEKFIKFCLLNFENNKNLFKIFCDFESCSTSNSIFSEELFGVVQTRRRSGN